MTTKIFDPHIAAFLVDSSAKNYTLPRIADRFLEIPPDQVETMTTGQKAWLTKALEEPLKKRLKDDELEDLYTNVELPLSFVLSDMEAEGFLIDEAFLKELSGRFHTELQELEKSIHDIAGETFNINSPKQLQEILFEKMGLSTGKKTKTGYSTNMTVLTELAKAHPIAEKIIAFRQFSKLISTYVDALPRLIKKSTGRVHSTLNQTVAATGRLSSTNPNLQNIPIRTKEGREIRKAFIAREGYTLLAADYSQIELRLLAHFSGDKALMTAFEDERDIHAHTASLIFKKDIKDVEKFERRMAKTVNFGVIYGMGPFRLAQDLKISRKEAKDFIDAYFETYGSVRSFMDGLVAEAQQNGYLTTVLGRRRYFRELNSNNRVVQEAAKREAINYPLQGSAADIIKIAMINIAKELKDKKLKSRMILQVHDELILEVHDEESEVVTKMVKKEMEEAISLNVPVKVDVGMGRNWFEAH